VVEFWGKFQIISDLESEAESLVYEEEESFKKELVMVFPAKFEIMLADKPQKTPSSQFQAADQPG